MLAVDRLGPVEQVVEREPEQGEDLVERPVVADGRGVGVRERRIRR